MVFLQLRKAPSIHAQLYQYWEKGCFIKKIMSIIQLHLRNS